MRTCVGILSAASLVFALGCGGNQATPKTTTEPKTEPVVDNHKTTKPVDPELSRVFTLDKRVRHGKLANGMTYYVLEHKKPEKRAQLWLGVNAGSILEDKDQQGLAHFVEHMAFNGTAKYHKQAIVNYLESIGMKFGPDLNAYTSFDQTVYMLQVPTDNHEFVDKGLDILHEWASAIAFTKQEVDKERGVVIEEWRLGRGAWKRLADKQYPVMFKGSRYAKRLPIGKKKILETAPRDALVRFYKDWYRPDMMAVVAVGDFDGAKMEAQIKKMFGDIKKGDKPRKRTAAPVPGHKDTLVSVETDPEMSATTVRIVNKLRHRSERTVGDYRRILSEGLYHTMLGARFAELRAKPDSPLQFAWSTTTSLTRTADGFVRQAYAKDGRVLDALTVLADEVARVERYGFTQAELDRAKKSMLRGYERNVTERAKTHGRQFAAEILRNFFEHEMMAGPEEELRVAKRYLPTFTLAELNRLAKKWSGSANRVILVAGPDKMKKPTRAQLLAIVNHAATKKLAPYKDDALDKPLIAKAPTPGTIVKRNKIAKIGVTEWTLSNGVRVVIKPTTFKNDQVLIRAESPGGHSLAPDANFNNAVDADSIVAAMGLGAFTRTQLRKRLTGKVVWMRPYIGELSEGLSGSASPKDLETAMQLVYLDFTAPRRDPNAFAAWQARRVDWLRNRRLRPETAFFEDMGAAFTKHHLRRRPRTPDMIKKIDLDKALAFYKQRFADASDFTFTIVGNVDLAKLEPLVKTYLASLPSLKRKEKWRDVNVTHPRGIKKFELHRGKEPKSFVYLVFHGRKKWTPDAANDIKMLGEVLQIRLREIMREDMGGVYFVSPRGSISRRPKQERSLSFFFPCAPKNVKKLTGAIFAELKRLRTRGVAQKYIDTIKKIRTRRHEVDSKRNRYWQSELARAYRYKEDPRKILDFAKWTAKISRARVKAAARRYGNTHQYFLGVLYPAKK